MSTFFQWVETLGLEHKILALLLMLLSGLMLATLIGQCAGPSPSPIPPALVSQIDVFQQAQPVADSIVQRALAQSAAAQATTRQLATANRALAEKARQEGGRADSLAAVAAVAATASESATHWHAAYDARTQEVAALEQVHLTDSLALVAQQQRGDSLQRALVFSDSLRHRGSALLTETVRVATSSGCTVPGTFGHVHCPSRAQSAIGAVIATVVVLTVRSR